MNIYVSNLALGIQDQELMSLFAPFGIVSAAKVIKDRDTGLSKGFGFVIMDDNTAAHEAICQLHQTMQKNKPIKVSEAKPKPVRSYTKSPFKSDNIFY